MKDNSKKVFWRVFEYVWPQWPRLIVVFVTAIMGAILFTLSFMTIGPLLKVMMGEEGLHGWVDRKTCDYKYGLDFYVPDVSDFSAEAEHNIAYYLRVTVVEEGGPAEAAGIKAHDQIIGAGEVLVGGGTERVTAARLLEELAFQAAESSIVVQIRRFDESDGELIVEEANLEGIDEIDVVGNVRLTLMDRAQQAISFMPRGADKANRQRAVVFIIVVMIGVTIVRCSATFCQKYMGEKVVQVAIAGLREDFFAHVMVMPVGFFSTEGTSDTTSRLLGDTSSAGRGIKILLGKALREPLKAIGTLTGAMLISVKLTLIFLCCAPPTIVLLGLLGKKIKKASKRSLMSSALMLGKVQGAINALRVVKVYNRQERETSSYRAINRQYLRRVLRVAKVQAGTGPLMDVLASVAMSAALLVGVRWIFGASQEIQPSSFFLLLVLLGTTAESIRKASDVWNKIQEANAAAERVYEVIDAAVESEDPDAAGLAPLENELRFEDIVFSYPGSDAVMLKGVNLTVKSGQTIAVVGPNGSGKTTLINLIPRFYDADSGGIFIDGHDIRRATLKSLRSQISMVTQNVVTFNDTIAANIGYGKGDATREEIIDAARRSFAHEFIEPLPDGYETVIGEQGSGFSGGQLQRIVIARAVLKDPSILIFDEAMSQVDADSEAKIHDALSGLMQNRTCFVIAHRFSTVISADTIVVLDEGQIQARGTHEDLVKTCPLYQSLYETQLITLQ